MTTRRTLFWRSVMPRTVEESTTLAIDAGGQVGTGAGEARWRIPLPRRVGPATHSGFQPKLSAGSPG